MAKSVEQVQLTNLAPGNRKFVTLHRYGDPDARPKCYLQASIHAGEIPAMMAAHHLVRMLDRAEAEGRISAQIIVVPYANPIGLSQIFNYGLSGRFDLAGGGNFNRKWPDLAELAAAKLEGRLTEAAEENVDIIRGALREAIAEIEPETELDSLRVALASLACDADLVLDTHCDDESLLHCFIIPENWPDARDFAAELGCRAVLMDPSSGSGAFDESFSAVWPALAKRFPEHPIPQACTASTLELRGYPDVSDELGERDAAALFRVLQRRGYVEGDPGPLPELACEPTGFNATDLVRAPSAGIAAYKVALGEEVRKGQVIAEIIDPETQARRAVATKTDGFVLSRRVDKWLAPGFAIAKVVGREPLASRTGSLLQD